LTALGNVSVVMAQSPGTFTQIGNLKTPRQFHTATLLPNGKVLIAGGYSVGSGSFQTSATAEMYDPSNESFTATGGMLASRLSQAIAMRDGDGQVRNCSAQYAEFCCEGSSRNTFSWAVASN